MRVLFDGRLPVSYAFGFVQPASALFEDLVECRGGQVNGLCGAARAGVLSLIFGTHTGDVPLRIELRPAAPDLEDDWEDVVEVSFVVDGLDPLTLAAFETFLDLAQPPAGTYRVRFCARGIDEAHDLSLPDDEQPPDRYLLQLWPHQPWEPDVIVRQHAAHAAYWHGVARETPTPPPRPAPPATEPRREPGIHRLSDEEIERSTWGGRTPSGRLRGAGLYAPQLFRREPDLAEALVSMTDRQQREMALWCAERAARHVGRRDHPHVVAALDALRRGGPLPVDIADGRASFAVSDPPAGQDGADLVSIALVGGKNPYDLHPDALLLWALCEAFRPDPAHAVIGTAEAALDGQHPVVEPDELWEEIDRHRQGNPTSPVPPSTGNPDAARPRTIDADQQG